MRECATPTTRCSPGRAVGPRASSGRAPVAASRGQPPPGTISDPPWFPHPSPFVWPFCKTRRRSYGQRDESQKVLFKNAQANQAEPGVAYKRCKCVTCNTVLVNEINGHAVRNQIDRFLERIVCFFYRILLL